jgi:polar amino acid transport system substrate-binding protein
VFGNGRLVHCAKRSFAIGTSLGRIGEYTFITCSLQQAVDQRRRRLPYADANLMLKGVKDGTLGGMVLWQPSLAKVTNGDPAGAGLHGIPTDPVPASSVQVAALVSSRDSFLRSQIDDAINSLSGDGTIQSLLDQTKVGGKPASGLRAARRCPVSGQSGLRRYCFNWRWAGCCR